MNPIHPLVASLPDDVTLIAVSKQQPDQNIRAALDRGLRHFGENRVQEAIRHWGGRRDDYPDLTLHLIGPLQSNKARDAVALFDVIHTLDRPKIAHVLAAEMKHQHRHLPCFIQVNTGDEPQKSGIPFFDLAAFHHLCVNELHLNVVGLMCIPPFEEDPLPHFNALREHSQILGLPHLSMGMSSDYHKAINCGATHIRLGTAIFGERG